MSKRDMDVPLPWHVDAKRHGKREKAEADFRTAIPIESLSPEDKERAIQKLRERGAIDTVDRSGREAGKLFCGHDDTVDVMDDEKDENGRITKRGTNVVTRGNVDIVPDPRAPDGEPMRICRACGETVYLQLPRQR